jgi:hypothetical protein
MTVGTPRCGKEDFARLKFGWFALVPAMFVDLADARKEPYDHRN